MLLKAILAWIPLAVLAIVNGAIREKVYKPGMGEPRAHQVSTFFALLLFWLYTWGLSLVWRWETAGTAWTIGFVWLALTVIFEFAMGLWVRKMTMEQVLKDYNLPAGRLWVLVLVWVLILPYVIYLMRY